MDKLDIGEIEELYEDEITCPYCGWKDRNSWESNLERDGDYGTSECPDCGMNFHVVMDVKVSYSTTGMCEENNNNHIWDYFDFTTERGRCKGKKCLICQKNEFEEVE